MSPEFFILIIVVILLLKIGAELEIMNKNQEKPKWQYKRPWEE